MLAAIRTGLGKVPGSRLIALGTRPVSDAHWFAGMLAGGAAFSQTHAAEDGDDVFSMATIHKANPSLKHLPSLRKRLMLEREEAKRDPVMLASWKSLRLNMGTSDTQEALLLDAGVWEAAEGDAPAEGSTAWGIDLGTTAAQSAISCYFTSTGRLDAVACFPTEPSLAERGLRDGCGDSYIRSYERNELMLAGEFVSDVKALLRECLARWGAPDVVVSDRWREGELREALQAAGIPLARLDLRGQGYKDGGEDVRAFRKAVLDGKVTPVKSLLMRSAMAEARCISDPAGNAKLSKKTKGGRRLRARDDAAASSILAVSAGSRRPQRAASRRLRVVPMVG